MSETKAMLAIAPDDVKTLENLMPTMPAWIETVQDAVATAIVARELGLAPLSSFPDLMIINGSVGMTSKLMLALVYRAGHRVDIVEMSDEQAVLDAWRKYDGEWAKVGTFKFTWEQAVLANLAVKDTYVMYPADMLMNKAIARMVRFAFPDVLRGYVPDEIEDITGVDMPTNMSLGPTEGLLTVEEVIDTFDGEEVEE